MIVITVGHGKSASGGYDSGAVSRDGKYHEFKIARKIAKYAQKYYNANYNERCDLMNYNGKLSLQERINKLKDDTYGFINELHLNAEYYGTTANGTESYYGYGNDEGKKYADQISKNISEALGVEQRKNWTDKDGGDKVKLTSSGQDWFGIIRLTKPTAVLTETVFITNKKDLEKIKTKKGQKKCGIAIAQGIAEVREISRKKDKKKSKIKKGSVVKVNKGAKSYDGKKISDFVYEGTYKVDSLILKRAVLDKKGINTPFNIKDLTLVK